MPDTYVTLPNGSYVQIPDDATPDQLSALRTKLSAMQKRAPSPVVDAQGKSTYIPSEGGAPPAKQGPYAKKGTLQNIIAQRAAELQQGPNPVALVPTGATKRGQPSTVQEPITTEYQGTPVLGGSFAGGGATPPFSKVTKIGGKVVDRSAGVFPQLESQASSFLMNSEIGRGIQGILQDPNASQKDKAGAQVLSYLMSLPSANNTALAGFLGNAGPASATIAGRTIKNPLLKAAGAGFGAQMGATGAQQIGQGDVGPGIVSLLGGAGMAALPFLHGKTPPPEAVDLSRATPPQPAAGETPALPQETPQAPPLTDTQGRTFVQTGVGENGKPTFKMMPKGVEAPPPGALEPGLKPSPEGDYAIGARKSITMPERAARGLDPVELQLYQKNPESYMAGREAVDTGKFDPRTVAKEVAETPRALKPDEVGAFTYDRMRLNNALKEGYQLADDAIASGDTAKLQEVKSNIHDILDALDNNDQALRKGGREASAALNSFQMVVKDDYSLGTVLQKARVKYGGDVPEKVQAQVRDLQSQLEQAQTKLDAYTAAKQPTARSVAKAFGETNTVFTKDRADAARLRIREKMSRVSAGVDPTILADYVDLGGYYVEGGVRSFAAWAKKMKDEVPGAEDDYLKAAWTQLTNDKRLAQAKKRLTASAAKMEEQLASGELEPIKPPKIEYDTEYAQLRRNRDTVKNRLNDAIEATRPKTLAEKATALHREFILSGYSVFSKLFGATAWNLPVETLADTFGSGIGRMARIGGQPLRNIAAREGEFSPQAALKSLQGLMSKEAMDNAFQVAKTGINDIFQTAGYKAKKAELGGYFGRIHGFEKSFLQTAEFKKSFYMRLAKIARMGKDPNTPDAQFEASMGAANDAISQILQSDNKASTFINTLVAAAGRVHPAAGYVARTLVPITRVPANYLGRALQMTGLGIPEGVVRHINASIKAGKGIDIQPAEADAIGRAYKYGGVGLVAMYLGLNQPDWFKSAGFYPGPGKKGNPDSGGKPMDTGGLEIGGVHIPHILAHSPFVEAVQFWATVRRSTERGEPRFQNALSGLAQQAPGAIGINMMQAAGERGGLEGAVGEYGRSLLIPQLMQQIAKEQDKPSGTPWYDMFVQSQKAQYRHPKGAKQEIQYGLPNMGINPQFNRLTLPTGGKSSLPPGLTSQMPKMPKLQQLGR